MADADLSELQALLVARLQSHRDAVLWKIDGVTEYDLRRPLTTTGTNLLGLVKHLAGVEFDYFGDTFGRPTEIATPWRGAEDNADMWATAEESVESIVALYRSSWAHAQTLFDASDLTTRGTVPWWPTELREVTLGRVLAHVLGETARHVGHMDILRESLDGAAGMSATNDNLTHHDAAALSEYTTRIQATADAVKGTR